MAHCNLRTVLVCTLVLLVIVSGTLSVTPPPNARACNGCNFLLTWGSGPGSGIGEFNNPLFVAVDSAGNVYVADQANNRVEKFTSTGTYVSQLGCSTGACPFGTGPGQFNDPYGVAVDASGNVYVADVNNNRVEKFTGTGTFITAWGSYGSGKGLFDIPGGVAVDSSGNVYVTDQVNNRVEKFTNTGGYLAQWGASGASNGKFQDPFGVAVDASGNVYVADYFNNRVQKFTSSGLYLTAWGCSNAGSGCANSLSGPGELYAPAGVAVDSSGNVYVTDQANNRVEKFTSTGNYVTQWGSQGSGNGQFNQPNGIAIDSPGNVYVVDTNNDRIELFSDATNSATIALVSGWNLVSLPLVPLNTAIGKVLNDLIVAHNFTIVWSYQGGAWKSFTPPSAGALTTMQAGYGYWIYVARPSTLTLFGYVIAPPPSTPPSYSLSAGWNLVGFKPEPDPTLSETVSTYLTSITGDYSTNTVWLYDNPTGTWIRATGSTSIPVGEALWVYMTTPATLRP